MSDIDAAEARYKVAEICRLADVQPYVLKYWESEFPVLAAPKGHSGSRVYSGRDLKIVERIKKLLYDEGYTIAGAKKRLEAELKEEGAVAPSEPEALVLTPPAPEPAESTATRRRRAKAVPAPPAEPAPQEKGLELAETPVLAVHADAPPPEPSIPLEIDEEPSPAGDVDLVPIAASAKTAPVVRKIDPAPAPVAQSPDPRVATALAELKEIARLLSREEA